MAIKVLIENVRGLLAKLSRRDSISLRTERDLLSNFVVLLTRLQDLGYCAPVSAIDSNPRQVCRRVRAYLPCVKCPGVQPGQRDAIAQVVSDLMIHLSSIPSTMPLHLDDILIDESHPEFVEWLEKAHNSEACRSLADFITSDYLFRWKELHEPMYKSKGLDWPPQYGPDFTELILATGLTQREAEIVWYYERLCPRDAILCVDEVLELSQGLDRGSLCRNKMPTIFPGSRLWLRKLRRFALGPEVVAGQGWDVMPCLSLLSHREVYELLGNCYASSSYMISLVCQFVLAAMLARVEEGIAASPASQQTPTPSQPASSVRGLAVAGHAGRVHRTSASFLNSRVELLSPPQLDRWEAGSRFGVGSFEPSRFQTADALASPDAADASRAPFDSSSRAASSLESKAQVQGEPSSLDASHAARAAFKPCCFEP